MLTLRNQALQVVGLDDAYTGHGDVERAVKGMRNDLPTIGLSHIAEEADHLREHGLPLVFSGHTHAGQVTLARMHELRKPSPESFAGAPEGSWSPNSA